MNIEIAFSDPGMLSAAQIATDWRRILGVDLCDELSGLMDGKIVSFSEFCSTSEIALPYFIASSASPERDTSVAVGAAGAPGSGLTHPISRANVKLPARHEHLGPVVIAWGLQLASLINLRILSAEYEFEQNAKDPGFYASHFGKQPSSPLIDNGLPFPVNAMVIDTSRHPGRRIFRVGYIEAVSAEMWLGPQFWPATNARREDVLKAAAWLCEATELPNGVIYLKALDKPFTSGQGQEAELQNRLRALLYPYSYRWAPTPDGKEERLIA